MKFFQCIAVFLLYACTTVHADQYAGNNCDIKSPPADSGEDAAHGTLLKIYPRKANIDHKYSGCQTVWVQDGKDWPILAQGFFMDGMIVRMRMPAVPNKALEACLKSQGKLIQGDADICSTLDDMFPYESLSPGCLDHRISAAPDHCSRE